jgi:hypothetical protein
MTEPKVNLMVIQGINTEETNAIVFFRDTCKAVKGAMEDYKNPLDFYKYAKNYVSTFITSFFNIYRIHFEKEVGYKSLIKVYEAYYPHEIAQSYLSYLKRNVVFFENSFKSYYSYDRNKILWYEIFMCNSEANMSLHCYNYIDGMIDILGSYATELIVAIPIVETTLKNIGLDIISMFKTIHYYLIDRDYKKLHKHIPYLHQELYEPSILDKLNRQPCYPFPDGIALDLKTGLIRERVREDYWTLEFDRKYIPVEERKGEKTQLIEKFLREFSSSQKSKIDVDKKYNLTPVSEEVMMKDEIERKKYNTPEDFKNAVKNAVKIYEDEHELRVKEESEKACGEFYEYLLDILGAAATPFTYLQSFYHLKGLPGGGKSLLLMLMRLSFGKVTTTVNCGTIGGNGKDSSGPSVDKVAMENAWIVICEEINPNHYIDDTFICNYVGGGIIACRFHNQGMRAYSAVGTILAASNSDLKFNINGGIPRRLTVLECEAICVEDVDKVNEEKGIYLMDKSLKHKMSEDSELLDTFFSIITDRAIKHCTLKDVKKPEFLKYSTSQSISKLIDNDPLYEFVEKYLIFVDSGYTGPIIRVKVSEVNSILKKYVDINSIKVNKNKVCGDLAEIIYRYHKTKNHIYIGVIKSRINGFDHYKNLSINIVESTKLNGASICDI